MSIPRRLFRGLSCWSGNRKKIREKGQEVTENDVTWEIEAYYIAQCAYNTTLMLSPDVIIFGGGVMKQKHLKRKYKISLLS